MSLDVDLMVVQPCSVYSANITHNLGKMASEVKLNNDKTLYDVLWRPDEHGFESAGDIVDYLYIGWRELVRSPEKYKTYNPENGWGSYEGLVEFVRKYHAACMENLKAQVQICR